MLIQYFWLNLTTVFVTILFTVRKNLRDDIFLSACCLRVEQTVIVTYRLHRMHTYHVAVNFSIKYSSVNYWLTTLTLCLARNKHPAANTTRFIVSMPS